jgi:hypothetical protein
MLGAISFGYLVTNLDNAQGVKSAMEYCHSKGDSYSVLCNKIKTHLSYPSIL